MIFVKIYEYFFFQEWYGLCAQMVVARSTSTVQIYYGIEKMNAVLSHNLNVQFVQRHILKMLV